VSEYVNVIVIAVAAAVSIVTFFSHRARFRDADSFLIGSIFYVYDPSVRLVFAWSSSYLTHDVALSLPLALRTTFVT
jgi:hypothetical protein